jgi:hypothetical protein
MNLNEDVVLVVVGLYPLNGTESCGRAGLNSVRAKILADIARQCGGQSSVSGRPVWDLWWIE